MVYEYMPEMGEYKEPFNLDELVKKLQQKNISKKEISNIAREEGIIGSSYSNLVNKIIYTTITIGMMGLSYFGAYKISKEGFHSLPIYINHFLGLFASLIPLVGRFSIIEDEDRKLYNVLKERYEIR